VVAAGIHIVPLMPANDVVAIAVEAERIGYQYCIVADEGFHPDVYACLGAIAQKTDRIVIGPVTNGYTRHPAVTAAALATINQMTGGRAMVVLLAGGSMVLAPMGIKREAPYRVVEDTLNVLRRLWSGEPITWQGPRHRLDGARLGLGPQKIPIWVTARGPMILRLAGRAADGALITVKPDLSSAFAIVEEGAAEAGVEPPERIYLGRICYTPEMLAGQRRTLSYVLMDSPPRTLQALGLTPTEMELVEKAMAANKPEWVDPIVTDDLLARYQVTGTSEECAAALSRLVVTQRLDAVLIDVLSADLAENLSVLHDTYQIVTSARRLSTLG
jgi:5,10-methylenetetrahydromethanopterin reductase